MLHHQVMNCATQTNSQMLLRDWEEFFTHPDRDDTKLNVISLEFSQTKLESYVTAPRSVSYHTGCPKSPSTLLFWLLVVPLMQVRSLNGASTFFRG